MKRVASYDKIISDQEKEKIINDYIDNKLSIYDISKKYNIKSKSFICKLLGSNIRNSSERNKIAHKKYPERFKHTSQTKQKMRESRLKFMKEHPEKTAWRLKNMSYPEKQFDKLLREYEFYTNYHIIREFPVFPYFIDFAILNGKIAVEIDGSQHLLHENKMRDQKKDQLLKSLGWRVLRVSEKIVKTDWETIVNELNRLLTDDSYLSNEMLGFMTQPKQRKKKIRGKDGKTELERQRILNSYKVKNRPSKEVLFNLISNNTFSAIGKMYGVSDNAVRKWCKNYKLPYRKKDINNH